MRGLLLSILLLASMAEATGRDNSPQVWADYKRAEQRAQGLTSEQVVPLIAQDGFVWSADGMLMVCLMDKLLEERGSFLDAFLG